MYFRMLIMAFSLMFTALTSAASLPGVRIHDPYPVFTPGTKLKSFYGGFEEAKVTTTNSNLFKAIELESKILLLMTDENQLLRLYVLNNEKLEKLSINTNFHVPSNSRLNIPINHIVLNDKVAIIKIPDAYIVTDGTEGGTHQLTPEFPNHIGSYNNFWAASDSSIVFKEFDLLYEVDIKTGKLLSTTEHENSHTPYIMVSENKSAIAHDHSYDDGFNHVVYNKKEIVHRFKSEIQLDNFFITKDSDRKLLKFDKELGIIEYFSESSIPKCNNNDVKINHFPGIKDDEKVIAFFGISDTSAQCFYTYNKESKKITTHFMESFYSTEIISANEQEIILLNDYRLSTFSPPKYDYAKYEIAKKTTLQLFDDNKERLIRNITSSTSNTLFHSKLHNCNENCTEVSKLSFKPFLKKILNNRLRRTDPKTSFDPESLVSIDDPLTPSTNIKHFYFNNNYYAYGPFPSLGLYKESLREERVYWKPIYISKANSQTINNEDSNWNFIEDQFVSLGNVSGDNKKTTYITTINLGNSYNKIAIQSENYYSKIFSTDDSLLLTHETHDNLLKISKNSAKEFDLSAYTDNTHSGKTVIHYDEAYYLNNKESITFNIENEEPSEISYKKDSNDIRHTSCGNFIYYNSYNDEIQDFDILKFNKEGEYLTAHKGRILNPGMSDKSDTILIKPSNEDVILLNCNNDQNEDIFSETEKHKLNIFFTSNTSAYSSNSDTIYKIVSGELHKYDLEKNQHYIYPETQIGMFRTLPIDFNGYTIIEINDEIYEVKESNLTKISSSFPEEYKQLFISSKDNRFGLLKKPDGKSSNRLALYILDRNTGSIYETGVKAGYNDVRMYTLIQNKFVVRGSYKGYKSANVEIDPYCIVDNLCDTQFDNRPPIVAIQDNLYFEPGDEIAVLLKVVDEDLDNLTFTLESTHEWLNIDDRGVLRGTIPPTNANYSVNANVSDGVNSVNISPFTIVVHNDGIESISEPNPDPQPEPVPASSSGGSLSFYTLITLAVSVYIQKSKRLYYIRRRNRVPV
ncbi:hypothetical protein L2737_14040 [Shewanella electrodiphila]|uniref:Uncharacterized protein n=1 Tax=Shewanella electrodiphila TaxID=934143 RepID=A0ABT0KS00_9GAMM|nr:hypothetical protein [Shewanella electrodiphila]MCL1046434.1 hypothetical protein [Shewanella electrodiphila]